MNEDKVLHSKCLKESELRGKPSFYNNRDLFMITRKREFESGYNQRALKAGRAAKQKPQIKFEQMYHIFEESLHHDTVEQSIPKFVDNYRIPRNISIFVGELTWEYY